MNKVPTARQIHCLQLTANGLKSKEIASILGISVKGVDSLKHDTKEAFGAKTIHQAIARGYKYSYLNFKDV